MRRDRLQNRIAGSVFTLPVCAVLLVVSWIFPLDNLRFNSFANLLLTILVACILLETNNRFLLIRLRTQTMASCWALFMAVSTFLHSSDYGIIVALSLIIAHLFLFKTFEQHQPINDSFHSGLFLGVGILFVPWLVVFPFLFLLHQMVYLRCMTLRSMFALLIGAFFPSLVVLIYSVMFDDYSFFTDWNNLFLKLNPVGAENYMQLTLQQVCAFGFPFLLIILGTFHYLCTTYNDKISVRMMLYILVTHGLLFHIFIILQPQHLSLLLPSMFVCGCPFVSHFFTLTKGGFTNFLFMLSLLGLIGVGIVNICLPPMGLSHIL